MDATKMTYEDAFFDLVIDKGTLDALYCDSDNVVSFKMIQEMARVCNPLGNLLIITYGTPEERKELF